MIIVKAFDIKDNWEREKEGPLIRAVNLLYPHRCPLCRQVLPDQHRLVCAACEKKLRQVRASRCMLCSRPVEPEEEYCQECRNHPRAFEKGQGIFLYDDMWKKSIEEYKFRGAREYSEFYARCMVLYGQEMISAFRPDFLCGVPMYWKKQRQRGFNQSVLLAEKISQQTSIPVNKKAVVKIRPTKAQKTLGRRERRRNLEEAFRVTERLHGERILLVDDIFTTGSTVDALASALRKNGASRVAFLTLCIVP
ncbi:MAG: ComF family protein [Blautia sp.]|nr:ComF family protein [Blautia sp.]